MRKEIIGLDNFKETTLKKLGLKNGSAVFRLIHRAPETLTEQANVFNIKESEVKEEKMDNWRPMRHEEDGSLKLFDKAKEDIKPDSSQIAPEMTKKESDCQEEMDVDPVSSEKDIIKTEKEPEVVEDKPKIIEKKEILPAEEPILNILDEDHGLVIFKVSDRSAKIRKMSTEISEDFFDLTIEDAKILLKDVRKKQKELEGDEKVLMTESMRKTQKEGQKLALMHKYKRSALRIQLPDRHVIQAYFSPGATLNEVIEKVKTFLQIQSDLEVFITPPKKVLNLNDSLLDSDLVPAALVYMTCKNLSNQKDAWISEEFRGKLSNSEGAEQILGKSGVQRSNYDESKLRILGDESEGASTSQNASKNATNSMENTVDNSAAATKRPPTSKLADKSGNKVPRWFKPSKQ